MDVKINIKHLYLLCRCMGSVNFVESDVINLYTEDNRLFLSGGDTNKVICDTGIETAYMLDVFVAGREFMSYVTYLHGFKTDNDVVLNFLDDSIGISYKDGVVDNHVYLPFVTANTAKLVPFNVTVSYNFSLDMLTKTITQALRGTSSTVYSGVYNGVILFEYKDTVYLAGTDTVKCSIVETDITKSDKFKKVTIGATSAKALISLCKLLKTPCVFNKAARKFCAVFGKISLVGPLLSAAPPVEPLLELKGIQCSIDTKIFTNTLKGAMGASKTDLYNTIHILVDTASLKLKTNNFDVKVKLLNKVTEPVDIKVNAGGLYSLVAGINDESVLLDIVPEGPAILKPSGYSAFMARIKD